MHKFNPDHIGRLLSGKRIREVRPRQFLLEAGLGRGHVFVDVGCGPGFFTLPAARIVGAKGRAYAVDTEPLMLTELKKRRPPANVQCIVSAESDLPLSDNISDFILLAYVLHEAEDKTAFVLELKRLLKPGAKLLILDWKKKNEAEGPPVEDRLTIKEVKALLKEAGLVRVKSAPLSPSHYQVSAVKL